jgi:hypothetical protein
LVVLLHPLDASSRHRRILIDAHHAEITSSQLCGHSLIPHPKFVDRHRGNANPGRRLLGRTDIHPQNERSSGKHCRSHTVHVFSKKEAPVKGIWILHWHFSGIDG